MARWEPGSGGRLEEAALALYSERGYENTTVAEIAARAGVTERTFFRHYADKREVLFAGGHQLEEHLVAAAERQDESVAPIAAIEAAFLSAAPFFEERREFARRRHRVIVSSTELQERELIKLATLATALAAALCRRGAPPRTARLAAEAGVAVFQLAFGEWITSEQPVPLAQLLRAGFAELAAAVAPEGSGSSGIAVTR